MTMGNLGHHTESLLGEIEQGHIEASNEIMDLLDEVHDSVAAMIRQMRDSQPVQAHSALIRHLLGLLLRRRQQWSLWRHRSRRFARLRLSLYPRLQPITKYRRLLWRPNRMLWHRKSIVAPPPRKLPRPCRVPTGATRFACARHC